MGPSHPRSEISTGPLLFVGDGLIVGGHLLGPATRASQRAPTRVSHRVLTGDWQLCTLWREAGQARRAHRCVHAVRGDPADLSRGHVLVTREFGCLRGGGACLAAMIIVGLGADRGIDLFGCQNSGLRTEQAWVTAVPTAQPRSRAVPLPS